MNRTEYDKLVNEINRHMDLYYNEDTNEIDNYEYDRLMSQLKAAEAEHPEWITPESPTQKVGGTAKREAGVKVTHDVPMLSIEDVFDKESVIAWIQKVHAVYPECKFSVEAKIDGLSATLRYEKGQDGKLHFVMCETRGDGFVGEDVTANAMVIPDIRKVIDLPCDRLQIRGEVYMCHADFDRYNEAQERAGKKIAANPRNLAAGTLRQLAPEITKKRRLKMFIFNIQQGPEEMMDSHCNGLDILADKKIPVVYHKKCKNAHEVIDAIDEIAEMRSSLPYDIDGAVVKIDEIRYRDDFPAGSKYSSGHIAYKYPPDERVVVMDDIIVDVGRTGKLTFTGVFHDKETGKPAKLCGTSVSRATLHNQDYINAMKIGIGGSYKLFKSGEIIPKLNGCVGEPEVVFAAPATCPVCGSRLIREDETADIRCVNPGCAAQISRTIAYFASRDCMNIMGLGDTLVELLCSYGYLKTCADIYHLHEYRDELIRKGIIGKEKNTDKLLNAIEASKKNSPVNVLTGLGIRNVGKSAAKEIMKHYKSLHQLQKASAVELTAIDDIGETTASCITNFFSDPNNEKTMSDLFACGVNFDMPDTENSNKFAGMTIVVTGTLPSLGRKEVTELIEKNGGKCSGSVSKKTSFVVAGEAAGSKLTRAQELGIRIINEAELLHLINS